MKKIMMIMCMICLLCSCAGNSNLCNTLYCNPDIIGMTTQELVDEYGEPSYKETTDVEQVWTYEVAPLWQYGAKGKIIVMIEGNVVSETQFIPARSGEGFH